MVRFPICTILRPTPDAHDSQPRTILTASKVTAHDYKHDPDHIPKHKEPHHQDSDKHEPGIGDIVKTRVMVTVTTTDGQRCEVDGFRYQEGEECK